jgi:uncharacterized protein with GYD domain
MRELCSAGVDIFSRIPAKSSVGKYRRRRTTVQLAMSRQVDPDAEETMPTYVILSRFSPWAFAEPGEFKQLAAAVAEKIKTECPGGTWKQSFTTLGRSDVVDIRDESARKGA